MCVLGYNGKGIASCWSGQKHQKSLKQQNHKLAKDEFQSTKYLMLSTQWISLN